MLKRTTTRGTTALGTDGGYHQLYFAANALHRVSPCCPPILLGESFASEQKTTCCRFWATLAVFCDVPGKGAKCLKGGHKAVIVDGHGDANVPRC